MRAWVHESYGRSVPADPTARSLPRSVVLGREGRLWNIHLDILAPMSSVRDLRERCGLTQSQLAELAQTSQPTIAAYESGTKTPNLRTLERLTKKVGLELAIDFVEPMTREERRSLALHRAIARRLREQPVQTLRRARRNLDRMSRKHPGARPLLSRWRRILSRTTAEIMEVMLDPRPSARELRHVTPFAGVLTARERTYVYRRFSSAEAARK